VQIVDPADRLGQLDRLDIQVVDQTGLPASRHNAVQLQILAGVDLLMWNIRRHVNEIARK
jgi:hypothetical protein